MGGVNDIVVVCSECTTSAPSGWCLGKIPAKCGIGGGDPEEIAILETARGTEGGDEMNVNVGRGRAAGRG